MKIAFAGFRHGHIMALYKQVVTHPDVELVGACEEDAPTAQKLIAEEVVQITHESIAELIQQSGCDAVAVGDHYGRRAEIITAALHAGKHVISDKPICIRLEELDAIERLAREKRVAVGCLLDLRGNGNLRAMRRMIAAGAIGEVHTINFTAQHPLLFCTRPAWYFEPGRHGGTINDIAIHAVDLIPWLSGRRLIEVIAARAWNARLPQVPHFQDAGQLMLRLDNGGGVLGDVSYLAPDGCGYHTPQYWRITCHGSDGFIEAPGDREELYLATHRDKNVRKMPADPPAPLVALDGFRLDAAGAGVEGFQTADILHASRQALQIQQAADEGRAFVPLEGRCISNLNFET